VRARSDDKERLAPRPATLPEIVACLARQIAEGFTPVVDDMATHPNRNAIDRAEMQRLADLCDARHFPVEAARIRRWLAA
jgi:hypothetical protein